MRRALAAGMIVLLFWGRLACADILKRSPSDAVCRLESVGDLMLGFRDNHCLSVDSINFFGVQEGADALLHHALRLVQNNPHQYAAVLFYAPWCPFSRAFQPSFSLLSSLYPTIPHFSIKESVLRPSTLSKYGVHGFPSLYLLNSTMRVNYHGSRNLTSVLAFYKEVTGLESTTRALEGTTLEEIKDPSNLSGKHINVEDEIYLALATIFVLTRLIYFLYPTVLVCGQCFVNYMRSMSFLGSLEHFLGYLQQATVHSSSNSTYCTRMESRKRSNFQEGAMNARVWASKSLTTVSTIGETSTNSSR